MVRTGSGKHIHSHSGINNTKHYQWDDHRDASHAHFAMTQHLMNVLRQRSGDKKDTRKLQGLIDAHAGFARHHREQAVKDLLHGKQKGRSQEDLSLREKSLGSTFDLVKAKGEPKKTTTHFTYQNHTLDRHPAHLGIKQDTHVAVADHPKHGLVHVHSVGDEFHVRNSSGETVDKIPHKGNVFRRGPRPKYPGWRDGPWHDSDNKLSVKLGSGVSAQLADNWNKPYNPSAPHGDHHGIINKIPGGHGSPAPSQPESYVGMKLLPVEGAAAGLHPPRRSDAPESGLNFPKGTTPPASSTQGAPAESHPANTGLGSFRGRNGPDRHWKSPNAVSTATISSEPHALTTDKGVKKSIWDNFDLVKAEESSPPPRKLERLLSPNQSYTRRGEKPRQRYAFDPEEQRGSLTYISDKNQRAAYPLHVRRRGRPEPYQAPAVRGSPRSRARVRGRQFDAIRDKYDAEEFIQNKLGISRVQAHKLGKKQPAVIDTILRVAGVKTPEDQ